MKKKVHILFIVLVILLMAASVSSFADTATQDVADNSVFEIYFLDVGQGDAAVINCDGHILMVDGGNSESSDYIYAFLKSHSFDRLDYVLATHPDADHVGGLSGALNYAQAGIAFCTETENDTKAFNDFRKYLKKQKNGIVVPNAGDVFTLGSARVSILAPKKGEKISNNSSIVIRIVYGNTAFLFTGDAEKEDEQLLLQSKADLKSDVIKVGHHGSNDSTSQSFLDRVKPPYAVISVGENEYGHPSENTLKRLEKVGAVIYRTDLNGIIRCTSDGENISFQTEKNDYADGYLNLEASAAAEDEILRSHVYADVDDDTEGMSYDNDECDYIANKNSKKFHYPDCSSVDKMKEKSKWYFFGDREELIEKGYKPCGKCNP